MTNQYHGSCLCGTIHYTVTGFRKQVANCHCTMCRKFHGAAFGTLVETDNLVWLKGRELLKEYTAENGTIRSFCSQCGSSIGFRGAGVALENMEVAIATFDGDLPVEVDAQIFTHYKANWCKLIDGLPTFGEGREIT